MLNDLITFILNFKLVVLIIEKEWLSDQNLIWVDLTGLDQI